MTGSIHEVTPATGKAAEAFRQAIEDTRRRSPSSFDQWFSGVQLDGIDDHVLTLAARDEFVRDWVREHFLPDLLDTFRRFLGDTAGPSLEVRWRIASELAAPVSETRRPPAAPRPSEPPPCAQAADLRRAAFAAFRGAESEAHLQELRRRTVERARVRRRARVGRGRPPPL